MKTEFDHLVSLLKELIKAPSFSGSEEKTADLLEEYFQKNSIPVERYHHNILVRNRNFDPSLETILLNSHHDTVKPVNSWKRDPFDAGIENGRLYGLGSNDAGASVVSLIAAFLEFYENKSLKKNIILVLSAEEEISGVNGVSLVLKELPSVQFGIVGEPTAMKMAIAEKGLMVIDCISSGKAGHAARDEGENAIYKAIPDIEWFGNYQFPKISPVLGPVKMSVTMISAGIQHNQVPDRCNFTVDLRSTDAYTHEEILEIIKSHVTCDLKPRSLLLRPSGIPDNHFILHIAGKLGIVTFGSDALSDQALMSFPTVKIGPGDPLRSHKADEYISLDELKYGMKVYIELLTQLLN